MLTWIRPALWYYRYEDLEYIHNQLRTIQVRGMAGILDKLQSSYFPAFKAMFRDVTAGKDQQTFAQQCSTPVSYSQILQFSLIAVPSSLCITSNLTQSSLMIGDQLQKQGAAKQIVLFAVYSLYVLGEICITSFSFSRYHG